MSEWRPYQNKQSAGVLHEVRDAGEDVSGPLIEFRYAGLDEIIGTINKELYETMYEEVPVEPEAAG